VATLSIVLAAVLLLLPWQICACAEDGPHLKAVWDHSECQPPVPTESPSDDEEGADHECGALFTLDGSPSARPYSLPPPGGSALALQSQALFSAGRIAPRDAAGGPLIEPPGAGLRWASGLLTTQLLL
jgi:hypothetical protein